MGNLVILFKFDAVRINAMQSACKVLPTARLSRKKEEACWDGVKVVFSPLLILQKKVTAGIPPLSTSESQDMSLES